jgi:hypothetical protein
VQGSAKERDSDTSVYELKLRALSIAQGSPCAMIAEYGVPPKNLIGIRMIILVKA